MPLTETAIPVETSSQLTSWHEADILEVSDLYVPFQPSWPGLKVNLTSFGCGCSINAGQLARYGISPYAQCFQRCLAIDLW